MSAFREWFITVLNGVRVYGFIFDLFAHDVTFGKK